MAGKGSGVSTKIYQFQPKALHQHCRAQNLNIVIPSSCKCVPDVINTFDSIGIKCLIEKLIWPHRISYLFGGFWG